MAAGGLLWLLGNQLVAAERATAILRAQDIAALASSGDLPTSLSFPGEDRGVAQVVDQNGTVVASTPNLEGEPPIAPDMPAPAEVRSAVLHDLPVGDESRFVVVSLGTTTPEGPATVYTAASLEAADQTLSAVTVALLVGYPILLLVVALSARTAIGRALYPVEAIRTEVADIGERDLHHRVPESGTGDEIDRLAGTMNSMLARLERSTERQRRFVADASHELRSPVASLRTVLEVATAHPESATLQATVDDALTDTLRLEQLVADLLTLARLDDRGNSSRREIIDLVSLCVAELSRRNDPRIRTALPPEALIEADESLVRRAVANLVDNAARHAQSIVELSIERGSGEVALHVDDDGAGVAPADRRQLFERFTRLDDARARDEGGSGLGLAIVAEIAGALGGSVAVSDSALGGARFTLRLPAASA
jgi:signal transduction histidine kinase